MKNNAPSKPNNSSRKRHDETDFGHSQESVELKRTPGAENKDSIAANIFRKYYEALLQGYSTDFLKGNKSQSSFHCT
jgi:hypothetical protein